jgi:signal transduction histidine kinase/ligand-binding sensor domain-containing protein
MPPPLAVTRLVCWLLVASVSGAFAATVGPSNSNWLTRVWQSDDGLPNNEVTGLAQTPDGYVWVATYSRPARFDGNHFEEFFPRDFAGTTNQKTTALLLSRRGGLWMGTSRGQVIYVDSKGATVFTRGLPDKVVETMVEDGEGALWIAYPSGVVCRLKDGEVTPFGSQDGLPSYQDDDSNTCSLACDTLGRIWFAKNGQIGIFRDGHFQTLLQLNSNTARLAPASDGGIWICSDNQLMKYADGKSPENHGAFKPESADAEPTVLLEARDGGVWIGTSNSGLFHYDGSHFEKVPASDQRITSLMQDREGNLWVGTGSDGLDRIHPRTVELETAETGLPFPVVQSLTEDASGIWATTENGLLMRRENGGWNVISANPNWPGGKATCVAADGKGSVWIGAGERVLYCLRNNNFTAITSADGLAGRQIHALLVDRDGDLWIGEERPDVVQRLRGGKLDTFEMPSNIRIIRAMAEDAAGNIWIGSSGGSLVRIANGVVTDETAHTTGQQLSIRCLHATPDGGLWIGYADDGLGWLKDGRFARISTEQGFRDDSISQIVAGSSDWLWFGGDHGIFKVRQHELEELMAGRSLRPNYIRYSQSEGLYSLEANCGDSPGALQSRDGRLWIPMRTALAVVDPSRLSEDLQPPPVVLNRVVVDDQIVASYGGVVPVRTGIDLHNPQTGLRFPPGHRRLEFEFSALSYTAPENVRFRYRLEGFDDGWVDAGTQHTARYSRLPAGSYQFRVIACNGDGVWNETPATFDFTVTPFLWQTWWFRLAAFVAVVSSVAGIVLYASFRRLRLKLRRLEQKAALDRERARIARDIHDDLGGRLTEVELMIELARRTSPEGLNDQMRQIVATLRQAGESLDEIVWAVNPRHDTLPRLLDYLGQYAIQFLQTAGIRCRVDFPDEPPHETVSSEVRHNLFLAVKEALNNVARHSRATEIWLRVSLAGDFLNVAIEDNGKGFDDAPRHCCADGLRNMRQHMEEIGGRFQIKSRPGAGAHVSLALPWPPAPKLVPAVNGDRCF